MIENKATHNTKNTQFNFEQSHPFKSRLIEERRQEPSEGYLYMSTVGWIDRREKIRRKKDSPTFIFSAPGKKAFQRWPA